MIHHLFLKTVSCTIFTTHILKNVSTLAAALLNIVHHHPLGYACSIRLQHHLWMLNEVQFRAKTVSEYLDIGKMDTEG